MIPGANRLELEVGSLSFSAFEQGEGPLVLCMHGFPDTAFTWRYLLPFLARAGFRAVAVTMRGYEPSSQPNTDSYRLVDLAGDVSSWIDALGEQEAHLVAHDWGATIAYAAAKHYPEKVRSLTTMAVPHPGRFGTLLRSNKAQLRASSYIMFFQLKGISDAWVRRGNFSFFDRTWSKWSPDWRDMGADLEALKRTFHQPGVLKAALSYYRAAANRKDVESLSLLSGEIPAPTLGLYGENDNCILPEVFAEAMVAEDFPQGLDVKRIASAGHFLHLERPDLVNDEVLQFLNRT